MVEVCAYETPVTGSERGRINAALKELRGIYPSSTPYAIAFDIRDRAQNYRARFPGIVLTPQALVGNWSLLAHAEEQPKPAPMDVAPRERCESCDGLQMVVFNVRADGSEEMAPCPDCHPDRNAAGFWRFDGSRHNPPEPKAVRAAMIRLLEADHGDL